MEKFYEIAVGNSKNEFAWASGFHLEKGAAEFLSGSFKTRFEEFCRINPRENGIYLDYIDRCWPDVLGCGNPPPGYFISDRMAEHLSRIAKLSITPIPVSSVILKKSPKAVVRSYNVVQAVRGIDVDLVASGVPVDVLGAPIWKKAPLIKKWTVKGETWNGEKIFTWNNLSPFDLTGLLCVQEVKDLSERENWKNVQFEQLNVN